MDTKHSDLPWNYEGMVFTEGRYYHALWNLPIPKFENFPLGGDILMLLWRYDASLNDWVVTTRVRRNLDEKVFDSSDQKSWFPFRVRGSEDEMAQSVGNVLITLSGTIGLTALKAPLEHDVIYIKGDCNHAFEIFRTAKREWLHMQMEPK